MTPHYAMHAAPIGRMNEPLVSVVMGVCNADRFLAESIESIVSHTFQQFEFIIVDFGSTDKSRLVNILSPSKQHLQRCSSDLQYVERWKIVDLYLTAARLYWRQKRLLSSFLAVGREVMTRPVVVGHPLKLLLRRLGWRNSEKSRRVIEGLVNSARR